MDRVNYINSFNDFMDFLNKSYSHVNDSFDSNQIKEESYKNIICPKNQFYHIVDLRNTPSQIIHVSPNVAQVLGYSPEEVNLEFFYNITHPDDRDVIFKATAKLIDIQKSLQPKPLEYFGHLNYRIKNKDGEYIRIERKQSNLINDVNNYMVFALAIFTNISNINKSDEIKLYWTGPDTNLIDFSEKTILGSRNNVSPREKEIIRLIAKGNSSKEIAKMLNITTNTVDTHRRKILRKLGLKNSTELVLFAFENEYI